MSNFTDFVGGGGSLIGEYASFNDRGPSFTDENNAVWLRTGSGTLDTTTYPDADTATIPISYSSFLQLTSSSLYSLSNGGINISGDWAIWRSGTQSRYTQMNLSTGTINANSEIIVDIPTSSEIFAIGYITCTGPGIVSSIANTDNKFGVVLRESNFQLRMQAFNLDAYDNPGASPGTGALKHDEVSIGFHILKDSSAQDILLTSTSTYNFEGGIYWDAPNHKLYVIASDNTQGALNVYDFTGDTFGTSDAGAS